MNNLADFEITRKCENQPTNIMMNLRVELHSLLTSSPLSDDANWTRSTKNFKFFCTAVTTARFSILNFVTIQHERNMTKPAESGMIALRVTAWKNSNNVLNPLGQYLLCLALSMLEITVHGLLTMWNICVLDWTKTVGFVSWSLFWEIWNLVEIVSWKIVSLPLRRRIEWTFTFSLKKHCVSIMKRTEIAICGIFNVKYYTFMIVFLVKFSLAKFSLRKSKRFVSRRRNTFLRLWQRL